MEEYKKEEFPHDGRGGLTIARGFHITSKEQISSKRDTPGPNVPVATCLMSMCVALPEPYCVTVRVMVAREMALRRNQPISCCWRERLCSAKVTGWGQEWGSWRRRNFTICKIPSKSSERVLFLENVNGCFWSYGGEYWKLDRRFTSVHCPDKSFSVLSGGAAITVAPQLLIVSPSFLGSKIQYR